MAAIRNSISLQDKMTPVLRSIIRSMDSTLSAMRRLDAASNRGANTRAYARAERDIQRANNALIKMQNQLRQTDDEARRLDNTFRGMKGPSFDLINLSAAFYLIRGVADSLSQVLQDADQIASSFARIELQVQGTDVPAERAQEGVVRTALDTRTDLLETAQLFNRIMVSGAIQGPDAPAAALDMTGILNKAVIASGASSEESRRAIMQLSQALASGLLQGDELRSLREQTPGLVEFLAQGLQQVDPEKFAGVDVGDLKQLGADGELTTEVLLKAFWEMEEEIDAAFQMMPKRFGQAMSALKTIWGTILDDLTEPENALGRLNDLVWQFIQYLETPAGMEAMRGFTMVVSALIDIVTQGLSLVGQLFQFLAHNFELVEPAIEGALIAAMGFFWYMTGAFIVAHWGIILVVIAAYALGKAFVDAGTTIGEVLGWVFGLVAGLAGAVMNLVFLVYDGVIWLGAGILMVIQSIVQVLIYVGTTIWSVFESIGTVLQNIFNGLFVLIGNFGLFALDVIHGIAQAIDWAFGSNLAEAVAGWKSGLEPIVQEAETVWNNSKDPISDVWSENFYEATYNPEKSALDDFWNTFDWAKEHDVGYEGGIDSMAWASAGYEFGKDLGEIDFDTFKMLDGNFWEDTNQLPEFDINNPDSITLNGGNLDSVGKINSDVTINEEDLKLLRDMAARDFLLQLQTVTPVANVTFGDVRETADVRQIVGVIEEMVEEHMAVSMVGD